MARGKTKTAKPAGEVVFGTLKDVETSSVVTGDVDLPRPPMRVFADDIAVLPKVEKPVIAPVTPTARHVELATPSIDGLYKQLDSLLAGHLKTHHPDYSSLHPILVSLAAAKYSAYEALNTVRDPATVELLKKIKEI